MGSVLQLSKVLVKVFNSEGRLINQFFRSQQWIDAMVEKKNIECLKDSENEVHLCIHGTEWNK